MGVLEGVANLRHDGQGLARRDPAGAQQLAQAHPVHVLHQEIVNPVRLAELVERDDVRMIQPGQRLGLAGEPFGERRVLPDAGRQDLEGDQAVEFLLAGLIDGAHAALADQFQDFQLGEERRQFRHRRRRKCPASGRR